MQSLRSLIPSFILLALYIIADEFFSPGIGLICILTLGAGELIYTHIKEKRIDKFMLFTTLLFSAMSLFAMYIKGTPWEHTQSVIFEIVLCTLLGVLAFSKIDFTNSLPAAYRKTVQITPEQQQAMKRILKAIFYLLCVHLLVGIPTAIYADRATSSFVNGTLPYLIIAACFIFLFIRNRLRVLAYKKEEWLPIVTEKGEVTGKAPRSVCHGGGKLLHPVVHLHIVSPQGELFLQKRSLSKTLLPGRWDTAVGGHVSFGEKIEDALKREVFEELGIVQFDPQFVGTYLWESEREKELVFSFICTKHSPIRINNDEVDEGRFWTREEILAALDKQLLTPNFIHEYITYIAPLIGL